MKTLRLFVALWVAGAGLPALFAQPTPAEQEQMLEVLRKRVAEERAKSSVTPEPRSSGTARSEAATPKPESAEPRTPPGPAPSEDAAESTAFKRMLEALRAAVAKERGMSPQDLGIPPSKENKAVIERVAPVETASPQPAPEKPAGPKTKQERLEALLLSYKADQITPHEYHEQRAKILAEP